MRRAPFLMAVALVALAACAAGTDDGADAGRAEERAVAIATLRDALRRDRADVPVPTRASVAAAGTRGSILLATRENPVATAVLTPEVGNAAAITWRGGPVTIDLRGGIVSGTRGLGFDLISAETAQVRAAMAAGGGRYRRALRDLDGEGRLRRLTLDCVLEARGTGGAAVLGVGYPGRQYRETCMIGPPGVFAPNAAMGRIVNDYALDAAGTVRESRQWVAPRLGYLTFGRTEIAGP